MMIDEDKQLKAFLRRVNNRLVHYSPEYLSFLKNVLPKVEIRLLKSFTEGQLSGVMPVAICTNSAFGAAINSLPFFGSHGGPLAQDNRAMGSLRISFRDLCEEVKPSTITLVENPFSPLDANDVEGFALTEVDDRIGQFTELPADFSRFHVKTRNAIRKGQKLNQSIECRDDSCSWDWMQKTHELAIQQLGGVVKTDKVFNSLRSSFGEAANLWVGSVSGKPISGLVIIRYGNTIEYFTPVVDEAHRNTQALSALIYEVMEYYAGTGATLWNWGGTWRSQDGVYRFKSRWGAYDKPYRYFNKVGNTELTRISKGDVQEIFPYFYVYRYPE